MFSSRAIHTCSIIATIALEFYNMNCQMLKIVVIAVLGTTYQVSQRHYIASVSAIKSAAKVAPKAIKETAF